MDILRAEHGVVVAGGAVGGGDLALGHIIGVGRNYAEHAREMGAEAPPERPMLFTKSPASACLSGDEIVVPRVGQDREQVEYEGELAVVIGRAARDVVEADALGFVLGYCVANDVSARWWQKQGSGGQFYRGKSFDTFCPLGPALTPARDAPDPQSLTLTTRLNGEVVQSASTADMIFPVRTLIAELSRGATLAPGTVILTGTPSGVGAGRTPPRFLKDGDEVEVEIRPLGILRNRVRFDR